MTNYTNLSPATIAAICKNAVFCRSEAIFNGFQWVVGYPNGWSFDVVKHTYSYGQKDDLWELAVFDSHEELRYDTPITDDVIGWLSEEEIVAIAQQVAALPPEGEEEPQSEDCGSFFV